MAGQATAVREPTGPAIQIQTPYSVLIRIRGAADLLFHRWSNESVANKASATKGSAAKRIDDIESFVYRDSEENLAIPGEYVRQAAIGAAKYRQDPRSPRKSAQDITKAGLVCLTPLASLGVKEWDYLDRRRVMIQRNGVTRTRPTMLAGWTCEVVFTILLPEYLDEDFVHDFFVQAGRLIGIADFRPTFGRFSVIHFERLIEN